MHKQSKALSKEMVLIVRQALKETSQQVAHYKFYRASKDYPDVLMFAKSVISQVPQEWEQFDRVPFDVISRSFIYQLYNPKVGYQYKLEWERFE